MNSLDSLTLLKTAQNAADKIRKELEKEDIFPIEVYPTKAVHNGRVVSSIAVYLDGDWKHYHMACDQICKALGHELIREEETEETGSDCYPSIHYYRATKAVKLH